MGTCSTALKLLGPLVRLALETTKRLVVFGLLVAGVLRPNCAIEIYISVHDRRAQEEVRATLATNLRGKGHLGHCGVRAGDASSNRDRDVSTTGDAIPNVISTDV